MKKQIFTTSDFKNRKVGINYEGNFDLLDKILKAENLYHQLLLSESDIKLLNNKLSFIVDITVVGAWVEILTGHENESVYGIPFVPEHEIYFTKKKAIEIYKMGDVIEWSFEDESMWTLLAGKTFQAEIVYVDVEGQDYGVYADYGQDKIPFDKATLILKK